MCEPLSRRDRPRAATTSRRRGEGGWLLGANDMWPNRQWGARLACPKSCTRAVSNMGRELHKAAVITRFAREPSFSE
uniref:Uncharacterized protein n=1 Tax=Oryza rufipogon TaxID=4529 RepID=A0A0E0PR56_ORYRU